MDLHRPYKRNLASQDFQWHSIEASIIPIILLGYLIIAFIMKVSTTQVVATAATFFQPNTPHPNLGARYVEEWTNQGNTPSVPKKPTLCVPVEIVRFGQKTEPNLFRHHPSYTLNLIFYRLTPDQALEIHALERTEDGATEHRS